MKIKFYTLGCKVNQYDTQSIRERFLAHGFKEARGPGKSDCYLINTCTVTAMADQKSRRLIRHCISENPQAKVIVTGCMVKNDSGELAGIRGVSLIISKSFFSEGISDFSSHTRAFLKIQDGCDNFCSYCKVPLARGRSRSRPLTDVIKEARALAEKGFKEIVLTGICLGSYGKDLGKGIGLAMVIEEMEKIEGLSRIRLSSIEAGDITEPLIDKMSKSKKLCRHLHIPLQSGDDDILKKMRRKYSRKFYLDLIKRIKAKIPQIAITTDCLVGFPGEKERNFRNTLDLINSILPLRAHIFPYSPRKGTSAYLKAVHLGFSSPELVRRRVAVLKSAASLCSDKYKKRFLGRTMLVLFEGKSRAMRGCWEGYTDNYIKVIFRSRRNLKNRLVYVKLKGIFGDAVLASRKKGDVSTFF
ncbi:MAG: MiaB/RimO family radical SAM methylthiotransferase [Candidatus Omnitrophota bacterium]